jgi:hypothetical protein
MASLTWLWSAPTYPQGVAIDPLHDEIPIVMRRNFATDNRAFKQASVRALTVIPTHRASEPTSEAPCYRKFPIGSQNSLW